MKNWGPADYWVVGGAVLWMIAVLFILFLRWADIVADKPRGEVSFRRYGRDGR